MRFVVPLPPHGKGRPRFGRGRTYTPKSTVVWEQAVALAARAAGLQPIDGPVAVAIQTYHRRPQRPQYGEHAICKPDADNAAKTCLDGLRDFFPDEHVTELAVTKLYAPRGTEPCVVVEVRALRPRAA